MRIHTNAEEHRPDLICHLSIDANRIDYNSLCMYADMFINMYIQIFTRINIRMCEILFIVCIYVNTNTSIHMCIP
jgi:hypothetical protein